MFSIQYGQNKLGTGGHFSWNVKSINRLNSELLTNWWKKKHLLWLQCMQILSARAGVSFDWSGKEPFMHCLFIYGRLWWDRNMKEPRALWNLFELKLKELLWRDETAPPRINTRIKYLKWEARICFKSRASMKVYAGINLSVKSIATLTELLHTKSHRDVNVKY